VGKASTIRSFKGLELKLRSLMSTDVCAAESPSLALPNDSISSLPKLANQHTTTFELDINCMHDLDGILRPVWALERVPRFPDAMDAPAELPLTFHRLVKELSECVLTCLASTEPPA
jgi:hypothetical protein